MHVLFGVLVLVVAALYAARILPGPRAHDASSHPNKGVDRDDQTKREIDKCASLARYRTKHVKLAL